MLALAPWAGQAHIYGESRCQYYLCLLDTEVPRSEPSFQ